ncbi:MAG TPA: hypothetical protein VNH64_01420 [Parvularculaceae bacterium]|nr:hypothetical protein [Parvularculaceae bacterium]
MNVKNFLQLGTPALAAIALFATWSPALAGAVAPPEDKAIVQ